MNYRTAGTIHYEGNFESGKMNLSDCGGRYIARFHDKPGSMKEQQKPWIGVDGCKVVKTQKTCSLDTADLAILERLN